MRYLSYPLMIIFCIFTCTVAAQENQGKKSQDNSENNKNYDSAVAKGNIAIGNKDYKSAIAFFNDALKFKPKDTYALYQLTFASNLFEKDSLSLAEKNRKTMAQIKERERIDRFNRSMGAYVNYENAAQLGNFEDQLLYLKQFLNTIPDTSELNEYQANFTAKIDFSKKKIKTIRDYLTRTRGSWYQPEAVPYIDTELKTKYPNVNFKLVPIGQQLDPIDTSSLIIIKSEAKATLKESPRLNISDSSANTKMTLQSVDFKNNNLFCKVSIRNFDSTDFFTGPFLLTVVKKDKSTAPLQPVYVSDFPIILPMKEFIIVYVSKADKIQNGDGLSFEMEDLLKTKKLKMDIPGDIIAKENKRQL
jgi:tetratricopeptide (TPR) repeat protein